MKPRPTCIRLVGWIGKAMRKFDVLCLTQIQKMTPKKIACHPYPRKGQSGGLCGLSECDPKFG